MRPSNMNSIASWRSGISAVPTHMGPLGHKYRQVCRLRASSRALLGLRVLAMHAVGGDACGE